MELNKTNFELAMAKKCLSINQLSRASHVSKALLLNDIRYKRSFDPYIIGKLAKALDVDPEEIIEKEGE